MTEPSDIDSGVDRTRSLDALAPPAEAGRLDAFISYTRRNADDRAFVDWLRDALTGRGKRVWLDRTNIEPAADWRDRIARGIEAAPALIFVISPDSAGSDECAKELDTAAAHQKKIVPVVLKDVPPTELPDAVNVPNWIDCRTAAERAPALDAIVEALDLDIEWRDMHTRIAVRAREWRTAGDDRSYLLRGRDLREAEDWYGSKERHLEQPTDEQYRFITASRRASSRRQRVVLGAVATALVVAVVLGVIAWEQRGRAVTRAHIAQSEQMAAEATSLFPNDAPLGMLVSLQGDKRASTTAARDAAVEAARQPLAADTALGSLVHAVAFRPDGKTVAAGDANGHVTLWDPASGAKTRWIDGSIVWAAAFSPDGATLATGDKDGHVDLWNVSTGAKHVLADTAPVLGVAFSPDGRVLVTGDAAGQVVDWDVRTGAKTVVDTENGSVQSVAVSPDGQSIAAAAAGAVVVVRAGTRTAWADPASNVVTTLAFSPDGREVVSGDASGEKLVRSFATGVLQESDTDRNAVYSIRFSPDGNTVASGDQDGHAVLWDLPSGRITQLGDGSAVNGVAFSPDGRTLATGDGLGNVREWSLAIGAHTIWNVDSAVQGLAFSPDGTSLASSTFDGRVTVWNRATGERVLADRALGLASVAFSPDSKTVAIGDASGTVSLYDVATRALTHLGQGTNGLTNVAFSPDGRTIVTGDDGGHVVLWNVGTGTKRSFDDGSYIHAVTFSPDGKTVASGDDGSHVVLWNVATGAKRSFDAGGLVFTVAFSPDGATVASGGNNGRVTLRRVANGATRVWSAGSNAVNSVAFSSGGTTLATGDDDDHVIVWNVGNGTRLTTLDEGSEVEAVAFSPDGQTLASGNVAGVISLDRSLIWSSTFSSLEHRLCSELGGSNLTRAQWSAYVPGSAYRPICS